MLWHDGDVSDAVNKVNEPQKYLIVFLRDDSTLSVVYNDIFDKSEEMQNTVHHCVCLNLLKGEKEFQQFSDVYQATEVPSIYVISYLGKVVDVIKGDIDEGELVSRLKEIVLFVPKANDFENESNCTSNSIGSGEAEQRNVEEKMTEIKQKLAEKHRQKLEEEKAKAIEEELGRRDLGKKMAELKKFQKDQEEKDIKDEIKRQKQSDKDARLKVLRQIEEDKEERRTRFGKQENVSTLVTEDRVCDTAIRTVVTDGNCNSTRLQFRFPDGSSTNSTFSCDAQFSVVRQFVADHVRDNMGRQKFEITQFFPKKTLGGTEDGRSLSDLQLVPSASLAVLFIARSSPSMQVASYTGLLLGPVNYLVMAIVTLVQWVKMRLFGGANGTVPRADATRPRDTTPAQHATTTTTWEERQRRLIAAESRTIKKEGNLAQFSDTAKKEDDKDDATWNGNSTQQM